jgi:hypothetical protein
MGASRWNAVGRSPTTLSGVAQQPRLAGDGGQAVVFAVLALVLALSCVVVLGQVAAVAVDRAAAQTAADAAALAGVIGGRDAAVEAARANGGVVRRYSEWDGFVEVVVEVGDANALARGTRFAEAEGLFGG